MIKRKKESLSQEKRELVRLLQSFLEKNGSSGATEKQILALKNQIAKKHEEWMELVKAEEKISREIGKKKS